MSNELFLVDTNTFITPYKTFYPFDFAPSFWDFLRDNIESGKITVLQKVFDEVIKGNDSLSEWLKDLSFTKIDHRTPDVLNAYGEVLHHIQCGVSPSGLKLYNEKALREWADNSRADAWLVAAAMAKGYTLVSFEILNSGLGTNVCSHPKIPDVADQFNVKCSNLYHMMRALGFLFK